MTPVKKERRGKRARVSVFAGCAPGTICNGVRARFGARGHTFNFARPHYEK